MSLYLSFYLCIYVCLSSTTYLCACVCPSAFLLFVYVCACVSMCVSASAPAFMCVCLPSSDVCVCVYIRVPGYVSRIVCVLLGVVLVIDLTNHLLKGHILGSVTVHQSDIVSVSVPNFCKSVSVSVCDSAYMHACANE